MCRVNGTSQLDRLQCRQESSLNAFNSPTKPNFRNCMPLTSVCVQWNQHPETVPKTARSAAAGLVRNQRWLQWAGTAAPPHELYETPLHKELLSVYNGWLAWNPIVLTPFNREMQTNNVLSSASLHLLGLHLISSLTDTVFYSYGFPYFVSCCIFHSRIFSGPAECYWTSFECCSRNRSCTCYLVYWAHFWLADIWANEWPVIRPSLVTYLTQWPIISSAWHFSRRYFSRVDVFHCKVSREQWTCLCEACWKQWTFIVSGVAKICCEERQSWKSGHGALTGGLQGRRQ